MVFQHFRVRALVPRWRSQGRRIMVNPCRRCSSVLGAAGWWTKLVFGAVRGFHYAVLKSRDVRTEVVVQRLYKIVGNPVDNLVQCHGTFDTVTSSCINCKQPADSADVRSAERGEAAHLRRLRLSREARHCLLRRVAVGRLHGSASPRPAAQSSPPGLRRAAAAGGGCGRGRPRAPTVRYDGLCAALGGLLDTGRWTVVLLADEPPRPAAAAAAAAENELLKLELAAVSVSRRGDAHPPPIPAPA